MSHEWAGVEMDMRPSIGLTTPLLTSSMRPHDVTIDEPTVDPLELSTTSGALAVGVQRI